MAFVLREQASEIETRSLRTGTRKIPDGEVVDVLRRPAYDSILWYKDQVHDHRFKTEIFYELDMDSTNGFQRAVLDLAYKNYTGQLS